MGQQTSTPVALLTPGPITCWIRLRTTRTRGMRPSGMCTSRLERRVRLPEPRAETRAIEEGVLLPRVRAMRGSAMRFGR